MRHRFAAAAQPVTVRSPGDLCHRSRGRPLTCLSRWPSVRRLPGAGGVELHALVWDGGGGTPVLLVHGLASNCRTWEAVGDRLHRLGHPVAAVDLRGHGRSDKPDDGYDFATMGDDLMAAIDALGFDRPVRGRPVHRRQPRPRPRPSASPTGWRRWSASTAARSSCSDQWPDWDDCARALAPPRLAGTARGRDRRLPPPGPPDVGRRRRRGHPRQLRGPRRRHRPPVAHVRPPHARSSGPCGSTGRRRSSPTWSSPSTCSWSTAATTGPRPSGPRRSGPRPTACGCGGSRAPTTTSTSSCPTRWPPTCTDRRRAVVASTVDDPAPDPDDHGLGRDQPDDEQGPPRPHHPHGAAAGAGGHARHPVRVPGERRRHHGQGGGLLPGERPAGDGGGVVPVGRGGGRRSPTSRCWPACGRPGTCSPGPGSPSYALAQWKGSQVPAVLAEKLRTGGCVTFASAAAVTLGAFALPVYEVYKVGQRPHWLEGLDLLAEAGLRAAVVPHFNNAEGGNHDTRYCYMGERRLSALEDAAARRRVRPRRRRAHRPHPRPRRGHGHRRRHRDGHRPPPVDVVDRGRRASRCRSPTCRRAGRRRRRRPTATADGGRRRRDPARRRRPTPCSTASPGARPSSTPPSPPATAGAR